MQCPRCHHANEASAKFCEECAAPLVRACAQCGRSLSPTAKFCPECAHPVAIPPSPPPAERFNSPESYTPKHLVDKILTSKSALEGERKQVTVLFVDASGFTALSERLDPEIIHGLMTRAFELMLAEIHRYEGTVNQFLGDGVMALFGAPIAHEDHGRRAVQAALGIRRTLDAYRHQLERDSGIQFQVRQGLNTGLVVVGSIGTDLRMDYTAVGDTTNVAARLLQTAEPGQVVVSEAVHQLVKGFFHAQPLGDRALKGKAETVRAWEILSAQETRSRLDVAAERGLTPLFGRDKELAVLSDCFEKARAGQGQMVFIVGEPGIGKSRLLYEFRQRLGDRATWQEGRCVSFGQSTPFHPLIDSLHRSFGIEDGDNEEAVAEKLQRGIVSRGSDLSSVVPYIRNLVGIDPGDPAVSSMDPQERRGELFYALRRLLLPAAEARPQVAVYEDVHWTDKATEEYLTLIADSLPTSRVLVILTYRTGYSPPFGERSYQTRIVPGALSTEDSIAMARAMLTAERLPDDLQVLLGRKADGNPFFVEEMVRSLRESGSIRRVGENYALTKRLEDVLVPDTIQGVIAARIDRLPEALKRTLQTASVIGREFNRRLLDRISDAPERTASLLRELAALELIHEKRVFPEFEYIFKHALTQEVAYVSLLVQRRRDLHRRIGLAVEELYMDRVTDHYEALAYQFEKAEDWGKALEYYLKAGDKAARAFATRDALGLYNAAEATATRVREGAPPQTRMTIHRRRAELCVLVSDFERARAESEHVLRLARLGGDQHAEGEALVSMGQASLLAHQFDQCLDESRQAAIIAETIGDPSILAGSLLNDAFVYEVTGRLDHARAKFDHALTLSRRTADVVNQATALIYGAELESWEGHYARAAELYDEGIRLGRAHNILATLEGMFMSGVNFTGQGAYDRALAVFDEGLTLAERVGDENYTPRYLNSIGWLHIECWDLDRAHELNQRAAEGGRRRGDHESFANAELNLGDIALHRGDLPSSRNYLEGVLRLIRSPSTSEWMRWRYSIHLFASLGELALARGDFDGVRGHADECLERATRTRSRKYLVIGWRLRGEFAFARRRWDDAQHAFQQALHIAGSIDNPTQLWKTHVALARLDDGRHRPDLARRHWDAARGVIKRVLDHLRHPGLRASFVSAPLVREALEGELPS
jgi:class 3 adenylate cyclase/tetratricopeptide (TPR) repeat protein